MEAGSVLVDEARLLFADPQVLGRWLADELADGLVDVVFWGRDEGAAAERSDASTVDDGGDTPIYGWSDRPLVEAVLLLQRLEALQPTACGSLPTSGRTTTTTASSARLGAHSRAPA